MIPPDPSPVAFATVPETDPGHRRWFAEEVQPCEASLRSYLRQSLPPADVDDTVQECFLRILRAKGRGQVWAPRPFLFAIARNAVRDLLAQRSRAPFVPITDFESLPVLEEEPGVVESICHEQELHLLTEAINALPPRCREVMLLRKVKGLSHREIADLLGISVNTIENQIMKGARRCTDFLHERGVHR